MKKLISFLKRNIRFFYARIEIMSLYHVILYNNLKYSNQEKIVIFIYILIF